MKRLIPEQIIGYKSDSVSELLLETDESAKIAFKKIKDSFLNVNFWNEICGHSNQVFQLCYDDGNEKFEPLKKGDYIRIEIPGSKNISGEGYDWVKVEKFSEEIYPDEETLGFVVRPSEKPNGNEEHVNHFFKSEATNTFSLRRVRNKILAEVHGRNELINAQNPYILEKIRNVMVGLGSFLGGSKLQWQSLTDGLINLK